MSQHTLQEALKKNPGLWSVWLSTNICSAASLKRPHGKERDTQHMAPTGTEKEPAAQ